MATFSKLRSGNWRAQVRRKGRYASQTFKRRRDAETWALETERRVDRGESISSTRPDHIKTFADLIDLHIADMHEVKKPLRRSKAYSLHKLKTHLGTSDFNNLNRQNLIDYGRFRAKEGAGPVTLGSELSYINTIITHAAAVHGISVSKEPVDFARVALRRLGLVGRGIERDRRPTQSELDAIFEFFEGNARQHIPVARIVQFAVATAMRQAEICRIRWADVDERRRTVIVRDRKDPQKKDGNHQRVPLLDLTGYDAWALLQEQKRVSHNHELIFPYNGRSVGTAFRRATRSLGIEDLHFHDLRHEATSRLFEAGLSIERVALVTGHKDWKMLRRYTHLKPEMLFSDQERLRPA
ncbi:MAG: site-specific integrase [Hyphomicrobiaceae bacterium]|nr:site-specific integrase [Hyphomicrobiaceae bacterium]